MRPDRSPELIGASDISIVCGVSQYKKGIFSVYNRLVTGEWDDDGNDSTTWGHEQEPVLLARYNRKYANGKLQPGKTFYHPKNKLFCASPDAIHMEIPAPIDAKNISQHNTWKWSSGVPDDYVLQSMWQMYLMRENGIKCEAGAMYASLGGEPPEAFIVDYDDDFMKSILVVVDDFVDNYVRPQILPPSDASEEYMRFLAKYFDSPEKKEYVESNEDIDALFKQYIVQEHYLKQVQESVDFAKSELMKATGDKYGIKSKKYGTFSWFPTAGRPQTNAILEILKKKLRMSDKTYNALVDKNRGEPGRTARLTIRRTLDINELL